MIFFTDIQTNISNFCLLNIKQINNIRLKKKFIYMIDPSVYELKDKSEYSKINELHEIAMSNQHLISIDYPNDMNPIYSDIFIEKSIKNNLLYRFNEKYICTIQFKFQDISDFIKQFEYLEELIDFSTKIIGIGNLCRILRPNEFTDKVFTYLMKKPYYFHFYGLGLALIKKYLPYFPNCSMDSTKFTKAVNTKFKKENGVCCRKHNRDKYFLAYMNEISKFVNVIY